MTKKKPILIYIYIYTRFEMTKMPISKRCL